LKRKKKPKEGTEEIDPLSKLEKIKRLGIIAMFSDDYLIERLTLKGGNAIDLVHKTPCRASIDLDFSMESEFDEEELGAIKGRIEKALKASFGAEGYEVFDIDFSIRPPEYKMSPEMADFWGCYRIEFKLVESDVHKRFLANPKDLQLRAVEVNLPLNKKKFVSRCQIMLK
jgi:hypothetical protein